MKVTALAGINLPPDNRRVEPGESIDIDASLAEQWASEGIVRIDGQGGARRTLRDSIYRREPEPLRDDEEDGEEE